MLAVAVGAGGVVRFAFRHAPAVDALLIFSFFFFVAAAAGICNCCSVQGRTGVVSCADSMRAMAVYAKRRGLIVAVFYSVNAFLVG